MTGHEGRSAVAPTKLGPRGATALLVLSVALIHSDQNLLAPNLSAAAASLGITDPVERDEKLGGGLAFGLFLVGAPAALLIGAGTDGAAAGGLGISGLGRVGLLSLVLLIGAVGCGASAFARSYAELFVARAVTGVSLAGGLPLSMSFVSDLYGPESRTQLAGRLGLAMALGVLGGQTLSGWIGPSHGWRAPFGIVSFLMVGAACIVWSFLPEPPRSTDSKSDEESEEFLSPAEPTGKDGTSSLRVALHKWASLLQIRTFWLLLLQGIPGCVPWGVIGTFLPDYLHVDAGLTVHEATVVMTSFQVGGLTGTLFGAEVGQRLFNVSSKFPPLLMFVAGSAGVVPMWYIITYTPGTVAGCSVVAALGGFFASQTGPNVRAMLSNVTESTQRGVAFASFILTDDIGKGAGPVIISALVRSFGRQRAFAMSMLCWFPCAILNGMTLLTFERDEKGKKSKGRHEIEI